MEQAFKDGAQWQKENIWIPMEEELPKPDTAIIIMTDVGEIFNGSYGNNGEWSQVDGVKINDNPPVYSSLCSIPKEWSVIAWMYEPIFEERE